MSYGNCQETIILVQDWWNRNKTIGMGHMLAEHLIIAKRLLLNKDANFRALCFSHRDKIQQWNLLSRESKVVGKDKRIESMYYYTKAKMPSQKQILQYIMGEEESLDAADNYEWLAEVSADMRPLVRFINDGLHLEDLMEKGDSPCLFLPSTFTAEQREEFEVTALANVECHLCRCAQILDGAQKDRPMAHGTKEHLKSSEHIRLSKHNRDISLEAYNINRLALIALGFANEDDESLPELSVEDTTAALMYGLRNLGDSQCCVQGWWTTIPGDSRRPAANWSLRKPKNRSPEDNSEPTEVKGNVEYKGTGWIWGPKCGVIGKKKTPEEMEKWQDEAEAEVNRWLEESRSSHKAWAMRESAIYWQMWEDLMPQFKSAAGYDISEVEDSQQIIPETLGNGVDSPRCTGE
ncbi:hypothetical protein EDD85DRAFT_795070 [Armillaria nabsnona]|nr:hypothetical protein EDD85DRAFT_795070 [Armillaria nabsnona]